MEFKTPKKHMLILGLTGNRYAGKTSVSRLFRKMGVHVFDADATLKYIINYDIELIEAVGKHLGKDFIESGFINPLMINSDHKFDIIVELAEHKLFEAFNRYKSKIHGQYIVFESSLIFERRWNDRFDYIATVHCVKGERIYRHSMQEGCDTVTSQRLLKEEMSEINKNSLSNYVIKNYQGSDDIKSQLLDIDQEISEEYFNIIKKPQKVKRFQYNDNKDINFLN